MEDFNTYEYGAEQKAEGKWLAFRITMISLYVLYAIVYFIIIFITRIIPLGALIPVTLWIIIYFTWRYTSPDYKYAIEAGRLIFTVAYGKKTKKTKCEIKLSAAEAIAPRDELTERISQLSLPKIYSALPSRSATDAYAIIFKTESGRSAVFYFVATEKALKLIRFYNSGTVVTKSAH